MGDVLLIPWKQCPYTQRLLLAVPSPHSSQLILILFPLPSALEAEYDIVDMMFCGDDSFVFNHMM